MSAYLARPLPLLVIVGYKSQPIDRCHGRIYHNHWLVTNNMPICETALDITLQLNETKLSLNIR